MIGIKDRLIQHGKSRVKRTKRQRTENREEIVIWYHLSVDNTFIINCKTNLLCTRSLKIRERCDKG